MPVTAATTAFLPMESAKTKRVQRASEAWLLLQGQGFLQPRHRLRDIVRAACVLQAFIAARRG